MLSQASTVLLTLHHPSPRLAWSIQDSSTRRPHLSSPSSRPPSSRSFESHRPATLSRAITRTNMPTRVCSTGCTHWTGILSRWSEHDSLPCRSFTLPFSRNGTWRRLSPDDQKASCFHQLKVWGHRSQIRMCESPIQATTSPSLTSGFTSEEVWAHHSGVKRLSVEYIWSYPVC